MTIYVWVVIIVLIIAIIVYRNSQKPQVKEDVSDARYIIGLGGIYDGQRFLIEKEIIIGRDPTRCSLVYHDAAEGISSVHCKVTKADGAVIITDLGSSYGTFRGNGEQMGRGMTYRLEPGDTFYLANTKNTFIIK